MPSRRGFGGPELTEALYVGFLTGSFIFTALFRICFSHFTEKISRHFQEKALPPYRFQTQAVIRDVSSGWRPSWSRDPTQRRPSARQDKPSRSSRPSTQCPAAGDSGGPSSPRRSMWDSWRVFFLIFYALFIVVLMIMQNKIGVIEQEWSFLDGIKSGTSLKFG